MVDVSIDTKRLCEKLMECPNEAETEKPWYTEGEKYLYEQIVPKCIHDIPFTVSDIDFSAFDEDDIISIIDEKCDDIEDTYVMLHRIDSVFEASKPLHVRTKIFF